jgi:signal transduction histidine kinase/FixJ family two-component response regulator
VANPAIEFLPQKRSILLVDDEPGIRKVLGMTLADMGYDVSTANDGESALATCRQNPPHIVLLDIKLPGMDGIEVLSRIKSAQPLVEVIMITGHGDMDLAIKSIKLDAIDFITKPINNSVLEIALARADERISHREQIAAYTRNLENLVDEKSKQLVEAERLAAVGQAVEGLISAVNGLSGTLEGGMKYFHEMPCFISVHNAHGKIMAVNAPMREKLGIAEGANSWDAYENAGPENCPALATVAAKAGLRDQRTLVYPSGEKMPATVYTAPIKSANGAVSLVVEIAADVSEIKRLQMELATTRARYRELFDKVPCFISVQDKSLRLVDANARFKEHFDFKQGAFCYEVYKERLGPCTDCPVARTFADGRSHQSETVVRSKTGEEYNVLVWTAPLRDSDGNIEMVMEMSTDITTIRRLQDHLSTLGLFVGSVSHGIKGLLTRLDAGIYLMEEGIADKDEKQVRDAMAILGTSVARIKEMVLDILFHAKKREPQMESLETEAFCKDAAAAVELRCQAQGIEFKTDFNQAPKSFAADSTMLHSALVNILHNAVDACIAAKRKDQACRVTFAVYPRNGSIVFSVSDNGLGMDAKTREKLFTLFFSSKGRQGTGLGLFLARNMVASLNGTIEVESQPGQGATFRVVLPVKQ